MEPLSEGFERMLILDSDFRKWGGGKIDYYCNYYVFGGFGFEAAAWREDSSALLDLGDLLILGQCHAML